MDNQTLDLIKLSLAPLTSFITWGGFLLLIGMLRRYFMAAVSKMLADRIMNSPPEQQQVFIRFLVGKEMTLEELILQHSGKRRP